MTEKVGLAGSFAFGYLLGGVTVVYLRVIYRELVRQIGLHDLLLLAERTTNNTTWFKSDTKSLSGVEGSLGGVCLSDRVFVLVAYHLEIVKFIGHNLVTCGLIPVEIEVCRCSVCKVLKTFDLLRRNLSLGFIVVVLWMQVLFWLEAQNLCLVFFYRLQLVGLVEGAIRLFVGSKRLLN